MLPAYSDSGFCFIIHFFIAFELSQIATVDTAMTYQHDSSTTMSSLTKDEYAYLCQLLQTIDLRNWDTLESTILSDPMKFIAVSEAISRSSQVNGMTILHACIRFDPPPRIIQIIIRLSPFAARSVDCLNRTPLHIAAATRANIQTIMMLIHACQEACAVQDCDGKTPLHFACDVHW